MKGPSSVPPEPGRISGSIIRRRIDPDVWLRLRDELHEMYEYRVASSDSASADRWLRREYRRLALRVALGPRLDRVAPASALSQGAGSVTGLLGGLARDVRHSARGLVRVPVFTAALILTLGVGIGGTTLVFAIVHAVLISPLPYPEADRMVLLRTVQGENMWGTSMADVDALYETPPEAFEGFAAYTRNTSRIAQGAEVELVPTKLVTPSYFPLMGVEPVAGRLLLEDEGRAGAAPVVLITEGFAARSFPAGSDPVGQALALDGEPRTVVGILPDALGPLDRRIEVFPALVVEPPDRKGPFFFTTIAKLHDGVDPAVARAQLAAVSERVFPIWQESFPQRDAVLGFVDLKQALVGNVEQTLFIVFAAVGLLLLIASANTSSLLVARGVGRTRELAVRSALGASRARVVRLLLTESIVIAAAAAAFGGGLVWMGLGLVRRLGVDALPRVEEVGWSPAALGFFGLVSLGSWVLFGAVAAWSAGRQRTQGLAADTGRTTSSRGMLAVRRVLAGAQFAITVPLLVGAALLLTSMQNVRSESFGFDPEGLVSMLVTLPGESFPAQDDVLGFWATTLPKIEALPGVLSAGLADASPPQAVGGGNNFVLEGRPLEPGEAQPAAPWITADPGFFRALGIPLVDGRLYDAVPADTMRYAVVDESWAARFHPESSPVGARLRSGGCTVDGCPFTEIVGVVGDVKTAGLDDTRRLGTIYYDFARDSYSAMRLHVRARGEPLSVVPAVRDVIRRPAAGIPVGEVRTTEELAGEALAGRQYTSTLVGLLAAVALLLSIVGIYGTLSYFVRQHTREIGIRIALGGGPSTALRMVVRRGMAVAGIGCLVGLAVTPTLVRPLAALLYGVSPGEPMVLLPVVTGILLVALAATSIPGRRAAQTDPAEALRED